MPARQKHITELTMKKLFVLIGLLTLTAYPIASQADRDEYYEHHRHYRPYTREAIKYYPRPWVQAKPYREVIQYYPQPPRYRYYPQPYPQPYPQYYPAPSSYQNPSYQIPGAVPGLPAYQLSSGNPWATGLGAAAGYYLGNQFAR